MLTSLGFASQVLNYMELEPSLTLAEMKKVTSDIVSVVSTIHQ